MDTAKQGRGCCHTVSVVWEATKDLAPGSTKQANGGSKEAATQTQAAAHCSLWKTGFKLTAPDHNTLSVTLILAPPSALFMVSITIIMCWGL